MVSNNGNYNLTTNYNEIKDMEATQKTFEAGNQFSFNSNEGFKIDKLVINGKSYQATSTDPVSPSPDNPSEVESVKGKNLYGNITWQVQTYAYAQLPTLNEDYTLSLKLKDGKQVPAGLYVMFTEKGIYETTQKRIDIVQNGTLRFPHMINTIGNVKLNYISIYPSSYKDTLQDYFDVQLEKGTVATDYLPYDTIQVKNIGKNLFDKNSVETQIGYFTSDGTLKSGGNSTVMTTYTKIMPNNDMTISSIKLEWLCFYDKNKNFIERIAGANGLTSNTFNKNANYIRFQTSTSAFDLEKIQLELGTQATEYEPYQENTLNIDLQENELCSLPNNVKDELIIENGRAKIIRNVGKTIVAKGDFYYGSTWKGYFFRPEGKINKANDRLLCNRAIVNRIHTDGTMYENQANVMFVGNNTDTIETIKAKYDGATLYYQLATPIEIDLGEVNTLSTFEGANNLLIDTNLNTTISGSYKCLQGDYGHRMFSYGDDIGFIYTDFTFPTELIGNAGDNVTTILDKIKNTLGNNYEYFYDVSGNFRFQEIKNYLNTKQATAEIKKLSNSDYLVDMAKGKRAYNLDSTLGTSYSNNPQYMNIKNDYVV